jgi:hypothetical protein
MHALIRDHWDVMVEGGIGDRQLVVFTVGCGWRSEARLVDPGGPSEDARTIPGGAGGHVLGQSARALQTPTPDQ